MSFSVTIFGSNSALPAYGRNHSSQLVQIDEYNILIDCGEGTQLQLAKHKNKLQKINYIFISHLHGDHYLGLMGLIFSMNLNRRTKPLYLYSHYGLEEIITLQLKHSHTSLNFPIEFVPLEAKGNGTLLETSKFTVKYFPLDHRILCSGFRIEEKPKPYRINKEKLNEDIKLQYIAKFKQGKDVYDEDGNLLYRYVDFTFPPRKSRSFAYCSDTRYNRNIIPHIKDVDLLYHEATFLEEQTERAAHTFHSTTMQAAEIAKEAGVSRLLIGHYSARYRNIMPFLEEAKKVFPDAMLAVEGETIDIPEL